MIVAIVIGIIVGAAGFLPLIGGMNLAKKATDTSDLGRTGALLIGVFGSLAILMVPMIICAVVFRDFAVPMTSAEALALIVVAVGYGISRVLVRKK